MAGLSVDLTSGGGVTEFWLIESADSRGDEVAWDDWGVEAVESIDPDETRWEVSSSSGRMAAGTEAKPRPWLPVVHWDESEINGLLGT